MFSSPAKAKHAPDDLIADQLAQMDEQYDLAIKVAHLTEQVNSLFRLIKSERALTEATFVTFQAMMDGEIKRTELALNASDKAITKSEQSYDKRFELLNELRSGVATREQLEALEKRINEQGARLDRSEGHGAGAKDNKAGLYALLGGGFSITLIVIAIMNYVTTR